MVDLGDIFADRYVIQRLLGEGERKRTYVARDRLLRRRVALAVVKPQAVENDPGATAREVDRLAQAGPHAHIVTLHHAGTAEGFEYMVFEYMPGGDLEDRCRGVWKTQEHLTLDEVLRYGRQLCRVLSHIHGKRIIHLDVSPSNVWLDEHGAACLGDFDSAALLDDPELAWDPMTTSEAYVIPEIESGQIPDVRSDLFSFGALLYEIATAKRPPVATGDRATETVPPSSIRPDLPSSFDHLVLRLLSVSPVERPSSADEVMASLRQIATTSNVEATIALGEGDRVEFKWSLRYPRKLHPSVVASGTSADQLSPAEWHAAATKMRPVLEKEIASTVAAFLNTSGGTLLIGVADDGAVGGVESDYPGLSERHRNLDGWSLALKDTVQHLLGEDVWGSLRISLVPRGSRTVAVVTCTRRITDTWLTKGSVEEFYVRAASSTEPLSPRRAADYIREHWPERREPSSRDGSLIDLPPMRELDAKLEQIEFGLRRIITAALEGDPSKLPSGVKQRIEERLQTSAKKNPAFNTIRYQTLIGKLEYCDLREIQGTITDKSLWPVFESRFVNIVTLQVKFDQLAELRNGLRHSRTVDEITRKEGEAAILWFDEMLRR